MKKDILSLLPEELEADFAALGEPKYRAGQVFRWLGRGVRDLDGMSDLPKSLREKLKEDKNCPYIETIRGIGYRIPGV